jgi:Asp-tRNA(Asn)/Glu-tRNA(Gln) amidotransferase A subunit family amidase
LHGVPLTIKDTIETLVAYAHERLEDAHGLRSARSMLPAVARLKAAGAIVPWEKVTPRDGDGLHG